MTTQFPLFTKVDFFDHSVEVVASDKTNMFVSDSRINIRRLSGQNYRLLKYLCTGKSINVFSDAKRELGIGYLNSRCSDLIHIHKIQIKSHYIKVNDASGIETTVKEYLMFADEINRVKKLYEL